MKQNRKFNVAELASAIFLGNICYAFAESAKEIEADAIFTGSGIAKTLYFLAGLIVLVDIVGEKKTRSFGEKSSNVTYTAAALAGGVVLLVYRAGKVIIPWAFSLIILEIIINSIFPSLNINDGYFYHIFEFLFNWSVRLMIVGGLVGIIFAGLALLIGTEVDPGNWTGS
jgi:hypothetical protein